MARERRVPRAERQQVTPDPQSLYAVFAREAAQGAPMITLSQVAPKIQAIKAMTEANNHIGAWQLIATLMGNVMLARALGALAVLNGPDMPPLDLRPLRETLYRVTMEQARACMTPAAFEAVYKAT